MSLRYQRSTENCCKGCQICRIRNSAKVCGIKPKWLRNALNNSSSSPKRKAQHWGHYEKWSWNPSYEENLFFSLIRWPFLWPFQPKFGPKSLSLIFLNCFFFLLSQTAAAATEEQPAKPGSDRGQGRCCWYHCCFSCLPFHSTLHSLRLKGSC